MVVRAAGMAALIGLAACAGNSKDADLAERAQTQLVGLPKAALLSCAGVPSRQAVVNGAEYYTYSARPVVDTDSTGIAGIPGTGVGLSGGTADGIGLSLGIGGPLAASRTPQGCDATFVLRGGTVQQVSYPMGASIADCGALVSNCMAR
ncbi:hypothetical protein TSO221_17295 [Azospirillum sp. TSO22-1]|nr:hypothetical protein TSO221_17295 [Azospirillum sp. TSO22-1]